MTPTMGMHVLMMGIVATLIGGARRPTGVVLGALLLATARHVSAFVIGSQWEDVVAFAILLVILLARPRGLIGGNRWELGS